VSTKSQTVLDNPAVAESTGSIAKAQDRRFCDVERSTRSHETAVVDISGNRLVCNSLWG